VVFSPVILKQGVGRLALSSVGFDMDLSNMAGIVSVPLLVMVATSLFSHLEPHRQSIIYLRNTTRLCKANSFGRVVGRQRCP